MSDPASGATVTRLFDPDRHSHYAIAEEHELELRMLFSAMETLSLIADTPPGQDAAEITPADIAPVFHCFARHGQRILAEARTRFPHRTERKSA